MERFLRWLGLETIKPVPYYAKVERMNWEGVGDRWLKIIGYDENCKPMADFQYYIRDGGGCNPPPEFSWSPEETEVESSWKFK
jgi:hypothetical protein